MELEVARGRGRARAPSGDPKSETFSFCTLERGSKGAETCAGVSAGEMLRCLEVRHGESGETWAGDVCAEWGGRPCPVQWRSLASGRRGVQGGGRGSVRGNWDVGEAGLWMLPRLRG